MASFKDDREAMPALRARLAELQARAEALEGAGLPAGPAPAAEATSVREEATKLKARIAAIDTGEDVADYFLRVGDVLFSYFDARDKIAAGGEVSREAAMRAAPRGRTPANSIASYFGAAAAPAGPAEGSREAFDEGEGGPPQAEVLRTTTACGGGAASAIDHSLGFCRDKALATYLMAVDGAALHPAADAAATASADGGGYGCCPLCDREMLFFQNEAMLGCPECGHLDYILVDSEKPSYKDPPREISYFAYKKINHLNEWLAQFQAKETTDIPSEVLDAIREELKKERVTDMAKLKASKLKEILKKLRLSRYYDHVAHIMNQLNGVAAPVLTREVEERIRFMFREIQAPFIRHCPKSRSNFLSYSYVLYKFCELLELDELLPCFPLLKSREKLYLQDTLWQKLCLDLNWAYYPSI